MSHDVTVKSRRFAEHMRSLGYRTWRAPDGFADRVLHALEERGASAQSARPAGRSTRRAALIAVAAAILALGTVAVAGYVSGGLRWFRFGVSNAVGAVEVTEPDGSAHIPDPTYDGRGPMHDISDLFAHLEAGVAEGRYTVEVERGTTADLFAGAPDGSAGIAFPDARDAAADLYTFMRADNGAFVGRVAADPDTHEWRGAVWAR